MEENRRSLADLLEALPEIYQPIFGHENIESSRTFQLDRFQIVRQLADDIAKEFGRKLRILDFGCAQGYLSILLAQDGHSVVGVDYEQKNIDVCEALTYENTGLSQNLEFVCGDVTKVLELVEHNDFDLLVAFSVFHHIVFRDGFESTADVVAKINSHVPNLVGEFALVEEPLYWAEAQPQDPRFLLCSFPFIEQVGLSQTHLSKVQRPIIFCSRMFVLVGQALKRIDNWFYHERSFIEGCREPRRVFYCGELLVKIVVRVSEFFDDDRIKAGRREIDYEANFLESSLSPTAFAMPVLLDYKMNSSESKIVRSLLPGVVLSKCITELSMVECEKIIRQITHQLATLEKSNLYHSDLRTWNVLWEVSSQTASLIDFGAIASSPTDTVPPHDPFYSYALFVQTVAMQAEDQTGAEAARVLNPVFHLESRELDQLLGEVFSQSSSVAFFQKMDEQLQGSTGKVCGSDLLISTWFSSVADYQNRRNAELQQRNRDVRVGVLEQAVVDRDNAIVDRDITIYRVHTSLSWKITWPIRSFFPIACKLYRKLVNFPKKAIDRVIAIAVLPLIRDLQMRPELLKKISDFAKRVKIYNFLLNRYLKGEEEWVEIQPDKSFVMLGQRFDPEKWLQAAKNVREALEKKALESPTGANSKTSIEWSKKEFKNDVGVIVSLYRCEAFLPFFLESLKRQTIFSESQIYVGAVQPSNFELNLLNQFSFENSNVIFEIFDYRAGIYEVWNHGVRQTTSQFLTNMNVDDLRRDDSLELQAQFLKNHESIDVAYQDVYLSFEANAEWPLIEGVGLSTSLPHVSLPMMNLGFNPPHNAPMWRRRVHDEVGLFDETFKSAGDFDLWVRAFINGSKFLKMGEIHASYYFNPEGISTTAGGASLDETSRILAICHQEIESQKLNIDESPDSPNIKKYGLADGMTLDLIEEIGLLSRTSKL